MGPFGLDYHERHCGGCDRELLLRDGRRPVALFSPPPKLIRRSWRELYDDGRYHATNYVFCDERCEQTYLSWERNPESR